MNTRFLLVLIALGCFSLRANDPVNFPESTEDFLRELSDYMSSTNQKDCTTAFRLFEQKCRAGEFPEDKLLQIRNLCNAMLNLKMAPKPYFSNYLTALCIVDKKGHPNQLFSEWHQVLSGMLGQVQGRRFNAYKNFLEFSLHFFETHKLRDIKSGVQWQVKGSGFGMQIKDKKAGLVCNEVKLVASRKQDSIAIESTSGMFLPLDNLWLGQGGTVHWPQQQMKQVYARLASYKLDVKKGLYEAEDAELYHPHLFDGKPVKGIVEDKISAARKGKSKSFPRFKTAEKNILIDDLVGNVVIQGGISLRGDEVQVYGNAQTQATIEILDKQKKVIARASSKGFIVKGNDKISGQNCRLVLYTDTQDSILHPAVQLSYFAKNQKLEAKREKNGSGPTPFYASYQHLNMDADKIDWYIGQDSIVFNQKKASVGAGNYTVKFESPEYFDEQIYRRLQNVADYNPISSLFHLCQEQGSLHIQAIDFARKLNPRFDVSSIKSLIYDMAAAGFLYYEPDNEQIHVTEKTAFYAHASQGKKDFDNVRFVSKSDASNAVIHLPRQQTLANGIKILEFSSARKVAARPTHNQVLLLEDRNLSFDGRLFAGFASLEGRDFHFNYDQFNLEIDSVRYFDFFVPTGQQDKKGEPEALSLASRIEHLKGVLLIDAPANKSGKENIGLFPAFNSKEKSYVYYDAANIHQGCYTRDSFYFELKPFIFNNLGEFTAERLQFDGQMLSADIFPPFKEKIKVREEDHSFGFITNTSDAGWPLFSKKGHYKGSIDLSNQGLQGKGNVTYLWASIDSDDIVFKPKQMLSSARQFQLTEQRGADVEVPEVSGQEIAVNWLPYLDSMYIRSESEPFKLFKEGNFSLYDLLILTPNGLKGRGVFEWAQGVAKANVFSIGAFSIESDTADLSIKVKDLEELALNTKNVFARLDFDKQMGTVEANVDTVTTLLPYNAYRTSMNEYDWDMANETIKFRSEEGLLGHFNATTKDQKGLYFKGETALYDLKTSKLQIGGVPKVKVADAFVIPSDGSLDVRPGGKIATLENARIIADTSNKYHLIDRATVDIIDRETYQANGWYVYNVGPYKQQIQFDDIRGEMIGKRQDKRLLTQAAGKVAEADNFYIDHKTQFSGEIRLRSDLQNLHFDGFARLDASSLAEKHWFSINSHGDRKDLSLAFDEPKNFKGENLYNGLYISKLDERLYPAVMAPLHSTADREVFSVKGVFNYNEKQDHYIFGDSLKMMAGRQSGNLMTLNNAKAAVQVEGTMGIGAQLPYVSMLAAGQALVSLKEVQPAKFEVMAGLDLMIPEKVLKVMQTDLISASFDARMVDYKQDGEFYERALAEFIPEADALKSAISKMRHMSLDLPDKYDRYNLLFSRMQLVWNPELQSFVSAGDQLALSSINKAPVNRWLHSFIEIRCPGNNSDRLYLYLKSPSDFYYYFEYREGVLSMVSNNEQFNAAVAGLGKKDKARKMKDGELFEIQTADQARAQQFVQRIKNSRK